MREVICYRVGRKIEKNIYAQVSPDPSDDDVDLGRMDTEGAARGIVHLANIGLKVVKDRGESVVV